MRVADATDETFDSLTANGTVVVAFYMSSCKGYKAAAPKSVAPPAASGLAFKAARRRRNDDIRRALTSAAWNHSRTLRIVFAQWEQCRATCDRLNMIGFATFWIMKDGQRIAELNAMYEGGHRDSFRLARDTFAEWLKKHLDS
jgi:hypothetical protein